MAAKTATKAASKTINNQNVTEPAERVETVRVGDLHIDPRVQREHIVESKLDRIRKKYNPNALGTFEASRRNNGKLVLLDGMHRRIVIMEKEEQGEDFLIDCKVHTGLSLQEEAELFVDLNNQQAANALDLHKVRVVQKDPVALALDKAAAEYGWRIGSGTGCISAVKVLENLYYAGEEAFVDDGYGHVLVEDTIEVITTAWGNDQKAVGQNILKAVGEFLLDIEVWITKEDKPEDFFDSYLLAETMKTVFTHGPAGWVTSQRSVARGAGISLREAMRQSLVDQYNKKQPKKSRKLPELLRKPQRRTVRTPGIEPGTFPV